ncbi:MAG: chorismate mutase, partial [Deltaproteobacteria bacterium]|nr:chorismate mutase [Deltaproteobacteria bacterium]
METDNPKQPSATQIDNPVSNNVKQELENLRKQLDTIDQKIVSLLAKRQAEVERVVKLKKAHNIPVYHPAREENLISQLRNQGAEAGLNSDYIEDLYRRILRQSRAEQAARLSQKGVRAGAT